MALRLIRALPGERRFFVTVALPAQAGRNRRHGRGARTTRLRRTPRAFRRALFTPDAAASIASRAQRSVTIAIRPLELAQGAGVMPLFASSEKRNIFIFGA